jgi:hypothetical protein
LHKPNCQRIFKYQFKGIVLNFNLLFFHFLKQLTIMERTLSNPKRQALKTLSDAVRPLAIESQTSINAALLHIYAEETGKTPQDFKTFDSWKAQGFLVKKGAQGFAIWSRPQTVTRPQHITDNTLPASVSTTKKGKKELVKPVLEQSIDITFCPIMYLFHDGQVEKSERRILATVV